MKLLLLLIPFFIFLSCGAEDAVTGTIGENVVSINYRSPITLHRTSTTRLEHVLYDASGVTVLSTDTTEIGAINQVDIVNSVNLTEKFPELIKEINDTQEQYEQVHFYCYQWLSDEEGVIITYRQPTDELDQGGGVVIVGEYNQTDTLIYNKEKLWLPYPASEGTKSDPLTLDTLNTSDSVYTELHELNSDQFKAHGYTHEIICYRSGSISNPVYSYYQIGNGLVGMLVYKDGKRIKSLRAI